MEPIKDNMLQFVSFNLPPIKNGAHKTNAFLPIAKAVKNITEDSCPPTRCPRLQVEEEQTVP
jgi:hypothetical protein